jgi:hypothetical protein
MLLYTDSVPIGCFILLPHFVYLAVLESDYMGEFVESVDVLHLSKLTDLIAQ